MPILLLLLQASDELPVSGPHRDCGLASQIMQLVLGDVQRTLDPIMIQLVLKADPPRMAARIPIKVTDSKDT